jgi:hypothetical protein
MLISIIYKFYSGSQETLHLNDPYGRNGEKCAFIFTISFKTTACI